MHQPNSLTQAILAITILLSTLGTYLALSPPNPNVEYTAPAGDLMTALKLTSKHATKIGLFPLSLLAIHTATLAYLYPQLPPRLLRHGTTNRLNPALITWSPSTAIPLLLILTVGIPLRLVSYTHLGKNFTFALAEPDTLTTSGIYAYVQHPSYTGLVTLVICNVALFGRVDGVLSCWIPPRWFGMLRVLRRWLVLVVYGLMFSAMGMRTLQEERLLEERFGVEWAVWNKGTWRFVPGVL